MQNCANFWATLYSDSSSGPALVILVLTRPGLLVILTRNPKVLRENVASPPLKADRLIAAAHDRSTVFAR